MPRWMQTKRKRHCLTHLLRAAALRRPMPQWRWMQTKRKREGDTDADIEDDTDADHEDDTDADHEDDTDADIEDDINDNRQNYGHRMSEKLNFTTDQQINPGYSSVCENR